MKRVFVSITIFCACLLFAAAAGAQTSTFTYQDRLTDGVTVASSANQMDLAPWYFAAKTAGFLFLDRVNEIKSDSPVNWRTILLGTTVSDPVWVREPAGQAALLPVCPTITVNNPTYGGTYNALTVGAYLNFRFAQTFTQSGSALPITFSLNSGSLPAGLTLSSSGLLSGTPTASGTFPITVKATDSNSCTGTGSTFNLNVKVGPPIFGSITNPSDTLEFTTSPLTGGGNVAGSGFGPRITNHIVFFDHDPRDNNDFALQSATTGAETPYVPVPTPYLSATLSLTNQQYTGFTYGAGTVNLFNGAPNSISTGLVFGAGPSIAIGPPPGSPNTQQVSPLNSYDLLGAFNGGGGPRNGMFQSNAFFAPVANYPAGSGVGIDAEGLFPGCCANDANGGVQMFTAAQRMFDLNNPGHTADRYYYGDLVITFNRFVDNPVINVAGLGGSYRYTVTGGSSLNINDWRSTFFSTELELVPPSGTTPVLTKVSGNQFLSISGNNILNNAVTPNGESVDIGVIPLPNFNNFGAATGSVRVSGFTNNVLRFKVWLRGSDANYAANGFRWSALGSAVSGGVRDPLSGDIWMMSVTINRAGVQDCVVGTNCPALAPSAGVSVSGRVTTVEGRGVRNATVTLTPTSGAPRNVRTGPFGAFRFDNVAIGQNYTVSVMSRRFTFVSQMILVTNDLTGIDFVAQ